MLKTILAIETSCDETALALVEATGGLAQPRFKILKHFVASQIETHRPFGGVVPNLAKREHLKNLPILYGQIFGSGVREQALWKKIDYITVTSGPGLEPALWTGIIFAQALAKKWKRPLLGANHLEGHLYSFLLAQKRGVTSHGSWVKEIFPAIALIVSGGHTILLKLDDLTHLKKLGETRDDAAGEAFDKVARLLELPYPGGPEIEKLARKGNPNAIPFPRPMLHPVQQQNRHGASQKNPSTSSGQAYDFSFSGLKTAVLYYFRDNPKANKADIAASTQEAIVDVLSQKTFRAVKELDAHSVLLSGGVAANKALRNRFTIESKKMKIPLFVAEFQYNTDNAVMIAVSSYVNLLRGKKYRLVAQGDRNI